MQKNTKSIPCAYMITCRTYGTWLHGDARESVDPKHNKFLTPKIKPNGGLQNDMRNLCKEEKFILNAQQREIVLDSIIQTCRHANWLLYAAHVRSNHMHVVLHSEKTPEQIAVSLKAYATRYLKQQTQLKRERFWSRGASTGYIYQSDFVFRAMQYIVEEQGKEMACYVDPSYRNVFKTF